MSRNRKVSNSVEGGISVAAALLSRGGIAVSDMSRSGAPAPDEEPVAWAEGRGAAFPQADAGVDPGGAARDRA